MRSAKVYPHIPLQNKGDEEMPPRSVGSSTSSQEMFRRIAWEIASISVHLEEIRHFWARALGITGPQWLILTAIADIDREQGVAVNATSKMLHVDPSFVTTQSKLLEKKGLLRRKPSPSDARVVLMSLTEKSSKQLASLAAQQESLAAFVFEELRDREVADLIGKLTGLKSRLEKARLKVALDV